MAHRFEGRNLDEALASAAKGLGVERYRLKYGVVVERRGFLGGVKRIVIEAAVDETVPEKEEPVLASFSESDFYSPPVAPRPARDRERRPRGGGGRSRDSRSERPRGDGRRPREQSRFVDPTPPPPQEVESSEASAVRAWLEEFCRRGEFQLEIRTVESEEQLDVKLYGRDAGRFVAEGGELLDSVQVVINKALVGRRTSKRIELDAAGFKDKRTVELEEKAREAAEQVRSDGQERLLEAMTPIERRIVHLALRDVEDVTTESKGDGFYKRVAIRPAAQAGDAGVDG
jgi:spoIIIJ-associated protein